ncbi:flagellar L-ring protein [Buchnera aphidicola (Nipponaphis monzeni)]|uniref:Flagellar L-ring protein n=1 Tax=Buchnera aphidicola (Nipponaphis monzeni) TaxID=2495405 RepID=A0A455TAC1_9GAMM|nr:flagellar L-ring protein [Buchnera aphidicola (Nipponaphis monzeni)]
MLKLRKLKNKNCLIIFLFLICTISGCTTTIPHKTANNITEKISSVYITNNVVLNNGSIFQKCIPSNYSYQSLFEDYKPHNIGDIISVILEENITASNSSSANISKNGNANIGIAATHGPFGNLLNENLNKTEINGASKNNFLGKGSNYAKNSFVGTITVTVSKIFPNGNLKVTGEKKIAINQGTEFIRFSGVINPHDISKNNSVISTRIADSKIEYISHGYVNESRKMGWLQRLLLNIMPI